MPPSLTLSPTEDLHCQYFSYSSEVSRKQVLRTRDIPFHRVSPHENARKVGISNRQDLSSGSLHARGRTHFVTEQYTMLLGQWKGELKVDAHRNTEEQLRCGFAPKAVCLFVDCRSVTWS